MPGEHFLTTFGISVRIVRQPFYATITANLIKILVAYNWSPLFAVKIIH